MALEERRMPAISGARTPRPRAPDIHNARTRPYSPLPVSAFSAFGAFSALGGRGPRGGRSPLGGRGLRSPVSPATGFSPFSAPASGRRPRFSVLGAPSFASAPGAGAAGAG